LEKIMLKQQAKRNADSTKNHFAWRFWFSIGTAFKVPRRRGVMNSHCLTAALFAALLAGSAVLAPAQAKTMKECAAQWDQMKAANQTGGMKYRDFTKQCMSGAAPVGAAPAPAVPATAAPAPYAATPSAAGKTGRQAMYARERACGAEWKADKAAGRIQPGQKWPQYWSECNKRKKAQGM
jgi:hypothetical protein